MSCHKQLMCILLIFVLNSEATFVHHDTLEDTVSIAKCIIAIAENDRYTKPTVVMSNVDNHQAKNHHINKITKIVARKRIPQIVINNLELLTNSVKAFEENILIVLLVTNCQSLSHLNITIEDKYKYLISVNATSDENCIQIIQSTGHLLQHQDVTFMVKDVNNSSHVFITLIPEIEEDTCDFDDNITPIIINECTKGILKESVIFPVKKPNNLKKCNFNVGLATMYPYAIAKNRQSLQNLQPLTESQIRGSDVEIIKIITDFYNASLKLYFIYREEESPYLHLEYVPFILNGSLHACAGGLYRIYGDLVYYSGIYTRQAVIWVYAVERAPRSWQTVVNKVNGLYVFYVFYIGYSIIWILFCDFDRIPVSRRNTFLYSWGALLGTSSLQESRTWKQRILNISYLLLCLHLSAYISVQLYSHFTIQAPPQTLKTNEDVMESGRTPYLNYDTKYFVEDAKYRAFANTSENCANFKDCEDKTIVNKGLTVIPQGYFPPLQAFTAVDNEARILRAQENIMVLYHEMIVNKGSPFAGKFKWIVQSLFEAGICNRLYLEAIGLLIQAKAENANTNIMSNSYSCESGCAITISQIAGAIYLWFLGCGVSFVIFIIELIIDKKHTVIIFHN